MKKLTALALTLALILSLCVPALAAGVTSRQAQLTYRGISVKIDGRQLAPQDSEGKAIAPFIIDGTTYLPLRAVASAFGLGVDWDNASSTAILTTGGERSLGSGAPLATTATVTQTIYFRGIKITLDGVKLTPLDSEGNVVEPFIMDGTTYLPLRAIASALGVDVSWYGEENTIFLGEQPWWLLQAVEDYYDGELAYVQSFSYDKLGLRVAHQLTYAGETEPAETCAYSYVIVSPTNSEDQYYMLSKEYYDPENYNLYSYDSLGRLEKQEEHTGGETITTVNTYFGDDKLATATVTADSYKAVCTMDYNEKGDLSGMYTIVTEKDSGDSYVITDTYKYVYNTDGSQKSMTYESTGDGFTVGSFYEYSYDARGRLIKQVEYDLLDGEKTYVDTTVLEYMEDSDVLIRTASDSGATVYTYKPFF